MLVSQCIYRRKPTIRSCCGLSVTVLLIGVNQGAHLCRSFAFKNVLGGEASSAYADDGVNGAGATVDGGGLRPGLVISLRRNCYAHTASELDNIIML